MCAALLAATLATSVAQNVYSLNVVGYVNVPVEGGGTLGKYTMIANPLNTTNNTIGALLPNVPFTAQLYKYTGAGFDIATFLGVWDNPNYTLNPGEGAIMLSTEPFTNTFVGEVMQGNLTNNFPAGFSIRASMVPQAGTLTALGFDGSALGIGDNVYQWNATAQSYDIFTYLGIWTPSEPTLKVGESIWFNTAAPGKWVRSFTVN